MRAGVFAQRWRTHCRLYGIESARVHETRHTHATQYVARVGNNYHATQARWDTRT